MKLTTVGVNQPPPEGAGLVVNRVKKSCLRVLVGAFSNGGVPWKDQAAAFGSDEFLTGTSQSNYKKSKIPRVIRKKVKKNINRVIAGGASVKGFHQKRPTRGL